MTPNQYGGSGFPPTGAGGQPPRGAPPPGQSYPFPRQQQPQPQSSWTAGKVLLGVGLGCFGLVAISFIGLIIWAVTLPPTAEGAVPGNQMGEASRAHLSSRNLIQPGEEVIYYYDASISLDNSEACFFTDRRITYFLGDRVNSILWTEVQNISGRDEFNYTISVSSTNARFLRCEIAPLNGGPEFYDALMTTWRQRGGTPTGL